MLDKWLSNSKLKDMVQDFVEKKIYGKISANQVTLLGLLFGLLSALMIFLINILPFGFELMLFSIILMIISFVFDAFDGALARIDEPTTFGGILDMFCDRTVEVFIIIAVVSTEPGNLIWPGLFSLGAMVLCITMFLIVGAAVDSESLKETEKVIYYRKGLIERSETFVFLILLVALFFLRIFLLWLFGTLVLLTALLRMRDAYILFYEKKKIKT